MTDPTTFPSFSDPDHEHDAEIKREKKAQRELECVDVGDRTATFRWKDPHEVSCDYFDRIIARAEKAEGWL